MTAGLRRWLTANCRRISFRVRVILPFPPSQNSIGCFVSQMSSAAVAPEWLAVPDDPNSLSPELWPARLERDGRGALEIDGVSVLDLAENYGTPLYVFSERDVRDAASDILNAFTDAAAKHNTSARVYYASKAFSSIAVVRWVTEAGLGVDVSSRGELEVALRAGANPAKIGYHGNNKSFAELDYALSLGVGSIIIDSFDEIARLGVLSEKYRAADPQFSQNVLIRVNSGVHAETHDYLATAHEDQKFGFPLAQALEVAAAVREHPALRLLGMHCHIGSQIFGVSGFAESARRVLRVQRELLKVQEAPLLNLGGGFGIAYTDVDSPASIRTLADEIVATVVAECALLDIPVPALAFEPGRAIVGRAGITLYRVGTTKNVELDNGFSRRYVSVDGGMSDNARTALYGAQYTARLANRSSEAAPALSRVVGMHCESGDIVVDADYLPNDVRPDDLLAVAATGAYAYSLSSNYNCTPRPAVVAVSDGQARVIVRAETLEDLLVRDAEANPIAEGEQ